MKAALCYKGIFNINHINSKGIDVNFIESLNKIAENHFNSIRNPLSSLGYDIYTVATTYDVPELNSLYANKFKIDEMKFLDASNMKRDTWYCQLRHYQNIIDSIKNQEVTGDLFDLIMLTRPDIEMLMGWKDLNLDLSKFNIMFQHPSGNCDDNLWIFERSFFEIFEKAVDNLIKQSKITHEMNHAIAALGGQVHFSYDFVLNEAKSGTDVFAYVR